MNRTITALLLAAAVAASCEKQPQTVPTVPAEGSYTRLYVLNEGQMGMNNSTLDYFDFSDNTYVSDAFTTVNPTVALGLGDVGNDIACHDGCIWMVINNSGIVEVIDATTLEHKAAISVPTCRKIAFSSGYAYVTSWAGAYWGGETRQGAVYRINCSTLAAEGDPLDVGYQPEGITAQDGRLYVANSGGITDGYDNRLTVIDEATFTVEKHITVADNITAVESDGLGHLWISSPGNYWSIHSGLYVYDIVSGQVTPGPEEIRVASMTCAGGKLYVTGNRNEWDYTPGSGEWNIHTIDCSSGDFTTTPLSATGAAACSVPYGIWVSPDGTMTAIADAGDYINPGSIYLLDSNFGLISRHTAGVCPAHFLYLENKPVQE